MELDHAGDAEQVSQPELVPKPQPPPPQHASGVKSNGNGRRRTRKVDGSKLASLAGFAMKKIALRAEASSAKHKGLTAAVAADRQALEAVQLKIDGARAKYIQLCTRLERRKEERVEVKRSMEAAKQEMRRMSVRQGEQVLAVKRINDQMRKTLAKRTLEANRGFTMDPGTTPRQRRSQAGTAGNAGAAPVTAAAAGAGSATPGPGLPAVSVTVSATVETQGLAAAAVT